MLEYCVVCRPVSVLCCVMCVLYRVYLHLQTIRIPLYWTYIHSQPKTHTTQHTTHTCLYIDNGDSSLLDIFTLNKNMHNTAKHTHTLTQTMWLGPYWIYIHSQPKTRTSQHNTQICIHRPCRYFFSGHIQSESKTRTTQHNTQMCL